MSIGQELRTVGQGLESLDVEDFDLQGEGPGYFALGIPRSHAGTAHDAAYLGTTVLWNKLRTSWQSLTGQTASTRKMLEPSPGVLRILFTTEGILKLEASGITRRSPESTGVPDFTKLAQALRMVGEYLDAESAHLINVSKRGDRIAFAYATGPTDQRKEEWKLSQLHGRWLETYQQRHTEIARSQASH
jgi:hypothetical protein